MADEKDPNASAHEVAPQAPEDANRSPAPTPAAEASPPPAEKTEDGPKKADPTAREQIAARYRERRAAARKEEAGEQTDEPNLADQTPPFIAHEASKSLDSENKEKQGDRPKEAANPSTDPMRASQGYTLKVRGRDVQVANRDELVRLASEIDPTPGAFDKMPDAQLQRIAQMGAAGLSFIDEGKSFRDKERVAAPQPPVPQAGQPQQAPVAQPQTPNLDELRKAYVEKVQLGEADEAAAALHAYETAKDDVARQQRESQAREQDWRQSVNTDLATFANGNQDIVANETANALMLMRVTQEMAADLKQIGIPEDQLSNAVRNPENVTYAIQLARQQGLAVRSNADILKAAGERVRNELRLAPPTQAQQPAPAAPAASRVEEKRGLQAQPTRSGAAPAQAEAPQVDIATKRRNVVAERQNRMKEMQRAAPYQ